MNRVQKIIAEIARRKALADKHLNDVYYLARSDAYKELLNFIDSEQEEPKKCMYSKDSYTDEDRKVLCDGCEEDCKYNKKETVNNNCLLNEPSIPDIVDEHWWEMLGEEPVSEGLIEELKKIVNIRECVSQGVPVIKIAKHFAQWQKEQMMAKAFDFTKEHNTACVLASECLRNHGWFNRERDFNDLFRHLSCVDKLFEGKFSGKTKVIVIKED